MTPAPAKPVQFVNPLRNLRTGSFCDKHRIPIGGYRSKISRSPSKAPRSSARDRKPQRGGSLSGGRIAREYSNFPKPSLAKLPVQNQVLCPRRNERGGGDDIESDARAHMFQANPRARNPTSS